MSHQRFNCVSIHNCKMAIYIVLETAYICMYNMSPHSQAHIYNISCIYNTTMIEAVTTREIYITQEGEPGGTGEALWATMCMSAWKNAACVSIY